jgi:FAD:protein FMN transferase
MYQVTHGIFDPRVLKALEAINYRGAEIGPQVLEYTAPPSLNTMGPFQWISENSIVISEPIDLGGIGKGYTADCLAEFIEKNWARKGLTGYIVDAGGDLVVAGLQDNGDPWNIGVESPHQPDTLIAAVSSAKAKENHNRHPFVKVAICTSSSWKRSWEFEKRRVHHLINPENGQPVKTDRLSVTAIGHSAAVTEVIAKTILIRGPHQLPLRLSYLIVHRANRIKMSPCMARWISWLSPSVEVDQLIL